jgi:hypothetical protein
VRLHSEGYKKLDPDVDETSEDILSEQLKKSNTLTSDIFIKTTGRLTEERYNIFDIIN